MKSQSEKEFDNISNDLGYKVGDKYEQMTLGYFLNLQEGGDDEYLGEEYIECTVKYVTQEGFLIMDTNGNDTDDTFELSLFSGREIKKYYPDFTGDDDKKYFIPYYEGSPFNPES